MVWKKTKQKPVGGGPRAPGLSHSSASNLSLREGPTASPGLDFLTCKIVGFKPVSFEVSSVTVLLVRLSWVSGLVRSDLLLAQLLSIRSHLETFTLDSLGSKMTPVTLTS